MTRPRLLLLGAAWLALLAFAGFEFRTASQLRAEHALAASELLRLRAEADALRRVQALTAAEVAQAEQQLDALDPARRPGAAALRHSEIAAWLGRTKQLRQLFAENPALAIPEMKLLTDDDWLRVSQHAEFDTERDRRRALAALRTEAGEAFAALMLPAVQAFAKAFPGQKPANVQALASFFGQPPAPEILERYELEDPSGPAGYGPSKWFVQNKAPIDLAYDSRFRVSAESSFQNIGAYAWISDYHERSRQAEQDYAKANPGKRSSRVTDTIPFFNPPLPPDVAAALIQSEERK